MLYDVFDFIQVWHSQLVCKLLHRQLVVPASRPLLACLPTAMGSCEGNGCQARGLPSKAEPMRC